MIKQHYILTFFLLASISCTSNKKQNNNLDVPTSAKPIAINKEKQSVQKNTVVFSKIDSVSIAEIKQYSDSSKQSIFDYYKIEALDEVEIWSEKMFGRCCTEADLLYSELLEYSITATTNNTKYPYENLTDKTYGTAYVFKENEAVEISLQLKRDEETHKYHTELLVDEVLKHSDTLLNPFKLSLVNGYVKSEKTFTENGRAKELKIFLNDTYKGTVLLQDTPLIQEFAIDFTFTKDDTVKLIPISCYKGSKYNDICISEIQSSLSQTAHPSINKKYNVRKLWKKGYAQKQAKK